MRPVSRFPFSLYKKPSSSGPAVWYARFWDESARRYGLTRSTGILAEGKRERRSEAEAAARAMLPAIQFKPSPADVHFLDYVKGFWTSESPYVRERALVAKKPLSAYYVKMNHDDVKRHLSPFTGFKGLALKDLTPGLILDWMRWAAETGLSARRINVILQSMRVAVRYAVKREELARDPFAKIGAAREEAREKGILTPAELAALIATPASDPRVKAAFLLAALCGLRRGEVRGLLWGDVDTEAKVLRIAHNYVDVEGAKGPKCGSARAVPIPEAAQRALEAIRGVVRFQAPEDYVFASFASGKKPLGDSFFRYGFAHTLEAIGIDTVKRKARNLTFHGLRHTYVTLGRMSGLPDLVIQALAGHKSSGMMEHYSHAGQVIDFQDARAKLEKAVAQEPEKAAGGAV